VLIGIVQGLTECFPVSSSAHLVFAERILGIPAQGVALEVILHLGTLVAMVIFFREMWARILTRPWEAGPSRCIGTLVVATVPAALVGVLFRGRIEETFHNPQLAAANLVVCGVFLVIAGQRREGKGEITWLRALVIGFAQSVAILPGISRSGATVGTGLLAGMSARGAVAFSFMMAVPAILGASVVEIRGIGSAAGEMGVGVLIAAAAAAFLSGYLAIGLLVRLVSAGRLGWFGYYCCAAGALWLLWG
jgi:undecaprenyl-diphosphatase